MNLKECICILQIGIMLLGYRNPITKYPGEWPKFLLNLVITSYVKDSNEIKHSSEYDVSKNNYTKFLLLFALCKLERQKSTILLCN